MKQIGINPKKDLIFDLKVREMCKTCKRYGKKATCSPYIESVDYYKNLLSKYSYGIIYYKFFLINGDAEKVGMESSLEIWRKIIAERNRLFEAGHYFVIGFGAGSCKLCKKCSFPCPQPGRALVPLEATGIDVVKTMKRLKVEIKFPIKEKICRIGMVLYD